MSTLDNAQMPYPIGENDLQTRRLITQAQLYNPSTRAFFQAAGISEGMKVLDLGSGVGDVSLLLADLVGPRGRVVGVELKSSAVSIARARVETMGWRNAEFLAGDIQSVQLDQDYDAVVGRFVLMWLPDPLAVLERVVRHLRPGGVVAFQDNDFTFNVLASAPLPLFDRLSAWLKETQRQGGPDYHMGLKMQQLYQNVGLPAPHLTLDAPLGAGADWTGYQYLAETIEMLLPPMRQLGIVVPADVDTADLAERLRREAVENQAVIVLPAIIGASSRKPSGQP